MNHSEGHYNKHENDNNKSDESGFLHSLLSIFSRRVRQTANESCTPDITSWQPSSSESGDASIKRILYLLRALLIVLIIPVILIVYVSEMPHILQEDDDKHSYSGSTYSKDGDQDNLSMSSKDRLYNTGQTREERQAVDRQHQAKVRHLLLNGIKNVEKRAYSEHNILSVSASSVVDCINDESFASCPKLQSVELDCKVIGLDAFTNCPSLRSVKIKDHIYSIRKGAFSNCPQLESVLLGTTLRKIEDSIFHNSPRIREVSIPNNVKTHYFRQFFGCKEISTIYLLAIAYFKMPKSIKESPLQFDQCILYVPDAYIKEFRADPDWAMFKEIRPLSKSRYYNAQGWWK